MASKKILLVDDSPTMLMVHRMMLRERPYELLVAKNGREAVEKSLSERPDLVVMDVMMPEMNGFEACQAIREREETRSMPVILVTTKGDLDGMENGRLSGCTDYITKPVNRVELLAKLRQHLGE